MKTITVPAFELDRHGAVRPNYVFHRPVDKLHSRCIEYPFAASRVGAARKILDVGTVKADRIWVDWLESLENCEVHATDYDLPSKPFTRLKFHQADVRKLPLGDDVFDAIVAVSVVEHVGLASPQVDAEVLPTIDPRGDYAAVKELKRVMKSGGVLVMTVPFGVVDGLILNDEARTYTIKSLSVFGELLRPVQLEYYEYQFQTVPRIAK